MPYRFCPTVVVRGLTTSCLISALSVAIGACSGPSTSQPPPETAARTGPGSSSTPTPDEPLPPVASPYDALEPEARGLLDKPFTGDFDEMVKRRVIRAGVVYNRTQYFIDRGVQRGIAAEATRLFEEELNKRLKTGLLKVHVAVLPLSRDQLFPALESGKVDFVAAALTLPPERQKVGQVSSAPRTGVSEIVVTAKDGMAPATVDDLSGREVFVRKSSSYYESLQELNKSLASRGKPPVMIAEAP